MLLIAIAKHVAAAVDDRGSCVEKVVATEAFSRVLGAKILVSSAVCSAVIKTHDIGLSILALERAGGNSIAVAT